MSIKTSRTPKRLLYIMRESIDGLKRAFNDLLGSSYGNAESDPIVAFGDLLGKVASLRTKQVKFILKTRKRRSELYDLNKDPGEKVSLSRQQTVETEILTQQLLAERSSISTQRSAETMEPDEEHLRVLRALGYIN